MVSDLLPGNVAVAVTGPNACGDNQSVNEVLGPTSGGPGGVPCLALGQCSLATCLKANAPGAVGQAGLTGCVDRGEQDATEQTDVLQEMDPLLCAGG